MEQERLVKLEDVARLVDDLKLEWFLDRTWVWITTDSPNIGSGEKFRGVRERIKRAGFRYSREDHNNPEMPNESGRWFHSCGGKVVFRRGKPSRENERDSDSKEDRTEDDVSSALEFLGI